MKADFMTLKDIVIIPTKVICAVIVLLDMRSLGPLLRVKNAKTTLGITFYSLYIWVSWLYFWSFISRESKEN